MGATFTPIQGYLAGIFRSPGHLISSVNTHQLCLNPDFETGDLTNWTDECVAASTATVTASKGWKERSFGVVMVDDGTNLCKISQIRVLDEAMPSAQTAYRIVASCWVKFDASSKTASLKVTGLDDSDVDKGNGTVTMISNHPNYGDKEWGYFSVAIDVVATMKKVKVEIFSGAAQTYNIDNVSLAIVDQIAGAHGTIAINRETALQDITTFATVGSHGERTFEPTMNEPIVVEAPAYYIASTRGVAAQTGAGLNDLTASGIYTGHIHTTYRVEIDAAGAPDTFKWSKDGGVTWEVSTVSVTGSAQTLDLGVVITFGATTGHTLADYWDIAVTPHEGLGTELAAGTEVFVVLWQKKATKTEDRWEFWAIPENIDWGAPIGEIQRETARFRVTGLAGYADR